MNATVKLILRESYKRNDGKCPVYLRLTINRKSKYYSLNIFLKKEDLLKNKFKVKDSIQNSKIINLRLTDSLSKAEQILLDFLKFDTPPTFIEFEKIFKGNYSKKYFKSFAKKWIENNSELSAHTKKTYTGQLTKLENYTKTFDKISFQEINNMDFIEGYKKYMIEKLNNKTNTIYKSLAFIKTVLNVAKNNSIISKNVFDKIELKRVPGYREYLTYSEVEKLEKLYYSNKLNKRQKNVLRYFLFSCYTGLRYTDIKNLTYGDLMDHETLNPDTNKKEIWKVIQILMHKTKINVEIPIIFKALKLIHLKEKKDNNQKVFKVISNQKTNKYLKEVIKKAKIERWEKITYHCSRHTFAINSIRNGITYRYVSNLLGHTSTKTTQIYTNPNRDYLIYEMNKHNNK